ncbi:hypothetical protein FKV24_011455 [Lysobacter maris]|uniref:Uncharacterized protein n=1 Tax=Marilutibacter maris TaxID=1605891 RepID=A0A508AN13_9GAMM|nr:hypothetical protein [Lysobacter maris]KAB8181818.1 hypothetical protein FKV24_011455 [Lysobacter maris]
MNRSRNRLLCLALAAAWLPTAASADETPAIHNVVTVTEQRCQGPAILQWAVHPRRRQAQESGSLALGDTGYRVDLSALAPFREWTLMERLHDGSRGVDDSYALFSRDGSGPIEAAYVITRLPEDLRDNELALRQVVAIQQGNTGDGKASFIEADTPFGRGLEMVVGGRVGSTCYPTARFLYATAEAPSIGISRFVVRNDDLIEYSLVMSWPDGVGQGAIIEQAQRRMDGFQRGLAAADPR